VIKAGAKVFVERGYGATTVDEIAARAGVGRATVFKAVGGKPAVLCAAHHMAIVGRDDPRPPHEAGLAERWAGAIGTAPLLEGYVSVVADVFEGVGPLHEVMVQAASEAEELRGRLADIERERHEAGTRTALVLRDELRAGLTVDRAADILWVHNDPLLWQALHARRGWTKTEFSEWLARSLRAQLLD
jgi:AcrR family transcriptional regulator